MSIIASFNMGVYYILASLNDFKPFHNWTVPFRGLTFLVITTTAVTGLAPAHFIAAGSWELTGAISPGLALRNELPQKKIVLSREGNIAAVHVRRNDNKD